MKISLIIGVFIMNIMGQSLEAKNEYNAEKIDISFKNVTNFHSVAPNLASSGLIKLDDYQLIKDYGFKHVINLIPGEQMEERAHVKSLGLSYSQIQVDWSEPSLDNFERFTELMKSYGKDNVYVHCEANYRASTFVYLYRVTKLGVPLADAKKELLKVWTPSQTWQDFIEKVLF